jgi:hypothetical protein
VRFVDFLRTAVILFGGAGTALAVATVVGAAGDDDRTLVYLAGGWWLAAALIGLWIGRRMRATNGIARLLAEARATTTLPELEPGTVLFNRLWPLAAITVVAVGVAFLFPQVPGVAAGYAILMALAWRKQSAAVDAIEGRDGVQYYFERSSAFRGPRLLRAPGFRKIEPPAEPERVATPNG